MKPVYLSDNGVVANGTDQTDAIMSCIYANRGGVIVVDPPPGQAFLCAGLMLDDSSYDGTTIQFNGYLQLMPDAGQSNFCGGWVGMLLGQCNDVTLIRPRFDGNRLSMTQREQIICLGLAGTTNATIIDPALRELRGDGMYIGQANWTTQSAIPQNIRIGKFRAINSADDGRNALTLASFNDLYIESLHSYGVGGVVNGVTEPGGLDIEPDQGFQSCMNLYVGFAKVVTAGTGGIGVVGKSASGNDAARDWNCVNININRFHLIKTGTSSAALSAPQFTRVADLSYKGRVEYKNAQGQGPNHDFSQRADIDLVANNVTWGAALGASDLLSDFEFKVRATNFSIAGVRTTNIARGHVGGSARGAIANSTSFGVQCHNNGRAGVTQRSISYTLDAPSDSVMARAFRNEPSNLVSFDANCAAHDCDYSGYANASVTIDAMIQKYKVRGLTYSANVAPWNGWWTAGDFVENVPPQYNSTTQKVLAGWRRLTSGNGNAFGVDWVSANESNT